MIPRRLRKPLKVGSVGRRRVAQLIRLVDRLHARLAYILNGIEGVNQRLLRTRNVEPLLKQFGATVGTGCIIHGPLIVHNADRDYSNLRIGTAVHIGRLVILDLTMPLELEDRATVSMGVTILSHSDVGDRPLSQRYPRSERATRVGAGSYVGANATVLAGCHVGTNAVVGAGAVVTRPVPPDAVVGGVPAAELHRVPASGEPQRGAG